MLAALCLASFMATLDLFVVNVALKDIGRDFSGQGLSNLSWILNAYAIIFGALLIPAGRMADKYGRRSAFVAGLAIFVLARLACALAPDLWTLVGFRCLQAAGAAVLTPASLGLVLTVLPADRVANGVRLWAVGAVLATAATVVILGQAATTGAAARFYTTWWVVVIAAVAVAVAVAVVVLGISPSGQHGTGSPDHELAGHVAVP